MGHVATPLFGELRLDGTYLGYSLGGFHHETFLISHNYYKLGPGKAQLARWTICREITRLNLSISVSRGAKINRDSPSNCE